MLAKRDSKIVNKKTCIKALSLLSETGTGGNVAVVDTKNGKIVRVRPLHYDWKYELNEIRPWKVEARGKVFQPGMKELLPPHSMGYKKRVYSPNRVLYPLKRVDWNPYGDRHPEKRGESKYIRISWDEATDIIASEIKRVKKKYGMSAILVQADGHGETKIVHPAHACNTLLLKHLGGYTLQTRNPDSWEGWYWGAKHTWGMEPVGVESQINVFPDVARNTELMLYWGCDPETTPWGFAGQLSSRICYWFTEIGMKSVYICPDLNYGAAVHADKWIPILPNTDAALRLAIAYVWISKGTYDKQYVVTHTLGFEKFEEYVLGKEDGIPKTPKWAEGITGVPSRVIKALAREWAIKRTSICHFQGGGTIRGAYSSEPARLEVLLLAMQGLGKPGVHQVVTGMVFLTDPPKAVLRPMPMIVYRGMEIPRQAAEYHGISSATFIAQWQRPGWTVPPVPRPTDNDLPDNKMRPAQIIPKTLIHEAILNPPISWYGTTLWAEPLEDQFKKYTYPAKGCSEVHMIWTDTPCWITCWNDSNYYMKALRSPKIEFILAQHPWMENDCRFADIILPANTKFEEDDIAIGGTGDLFDVLLTEDKCIEARGESKSDYEIVCLIAEKLGLLDKVTEGKTVKEWIKMSFQYSGASKYISYTELKEKGYFVPPAHPDWKKPLIEKKKSRTLMLDFYENPKKYPLKTPSGKIEFYSQNLAKHFPNDKERPALPHWIPFGETHQESLLHPRSKKYPLLCVSNHGRWRVHANLDDISWFHEACTGKIRAADGYLYEPAWIHPTTAEERGIKNGDIVNVFNERGEVLCGAYVTERIMPDVISVDHGSRHDPVVIGKLDRGGAINTITPRATLSKNATGMACAGFLVDVKVADMDGLRRQYPEAFSRPYDAGSGLKFERVLVGGEQ
jgi:anaerobic selenocysteine-containing dehydrogenase